MFKPKFRTKKQRVAVAEEKKLKEVIQGELSGYLKRDELQGFLEKMKSDERRNKLWESLSMRRKIKVLKYALERRAHAKK